MLETSEPGVNFDLEEQHFRSRAAVSTLLASLRFPLSVTLQVTRRCNLRCIYCSENAQIKEPTSEFLHFLIDRMRGIERVIISGGEPTLRHDLKTLASHLSKTVRIVVMASNAVLVTERLAHDLSQSLSYVDITVDGTREVHNRIRGQYDKVLAGIHNFVEAGIDVSLVTVLLKDNMCDILHVCNLADELHAKKLKILSPIRKGRGEKIVSRALSSTELEHLYDLIKQEKQRKGWRVRITITNWGLVDEGHALLVHPNGDVVASPVPSMANCIRLVGNLKKHSMEWIWENYPYKENHIRKYLEETLYVC
jgi:MoaA/NifB/PqqE/SkfB family radical SAM enzyme